MDADITYRNQELLDIVASYDVETEVQEHIPYPDGTVLICGLNVTSENAEGHVYSLEPDRSKFWNDEGPRLGHVVNDREYLGTCHAASQYLNDLTETGYDGRTFSDIEAFHNYVNDTASSGLFWPQLYPEIESAVVEHNEPLDDVLGSLLDREGYTSFTWAGEPEHGVESLAALVTASYEDRTQLHDNTHHLHIPADKTVSELLTEN